ncbi:MAG: hypothetical protein WC661_11910 [Opitutaceae bacterium]
MTKQVGGRLPSSLHTLNASMATGAERAAVGVGKAKIKAFGQWNNVVDGLGHGRQGGVQAERVAAKRMLSPEP